MSIRVPYQYSYRRFDDSPLATAVDRICHSPVRIPVGMILPMFLMFIYADFMTQVVKNEVVYRVISCTFAVIYVVWVLVVCLLGVICDKTGLSLKVALWDVSRRKNGGKLPLKFKLVLAAIALLILFPGIYSMTSKIISTSRANKYHEMMSVLELGAQYRGDKLVGYDVETERYSMECIPEELLAEDPAEVGYMLYLEHGDQLVGSYSFGVFGYQYYCAVMLVDLSDQSILGSEVFWGSDPPHYYSGDEDQYGSHPDEEEILEWVRELMD